MHPVQNVDGGSVLQTARNYPIDAATVIDAGAVVKLSGGKVVLAAAAETGAILGIAAEFHSGTEDALNLRANGKEIVVTDYAKTGTVMTKASGGAPGAGDVYEVYPVIGAAIGGVASLGDKRLGITLKTVGATKLRCIGHDYERGTIKLMAIGHALT